MNGFVTFLEWTTIVVAYSVEFVNTLQQYENTESDSNGRQRSSCEKCRELVRLYNESFKSFGAMVIHVIFLTATAGILFSGGSPFYEEFSGSSDTIFKVFGGARAKTINGTNHEWRLWDSEDSVNRQDSSSLFIATKVNKTKQERGVCLDNVSCADNSDCESGNIDVMGHGFLTGNCSSEKCVVEAWCPIEFTGNATDTLRINATENLKILIQSRVLFVTTSETKQYDNLGGCSLTASGEYTTYNEDDAKPCPLFPINSIIYETIGETAGVLDSIIEGGASILIRLEWKCDEDSKSCFPSYNFERLGDVGKDCSNCFGHSVTKTDYPFDDENFRIFTRSVGIRFVLEEKASTSSVSLEKMILNMGVSLGALKGIIVFKNATAFLMAVAKLCWIKCQKQP